MPPKSYFSHELFDFLDQLRENNTREWFLANKSRYERHVREPCLSFVADFEPYLSAVSRHLVADPRPSGGSLFRIYRDVRFSRDKSPFKTMAALHFRHEAGRDVHAPGFYLHLEPANVFAGSGIWHPDAETLAKIRRAIAGGAGDWKRAISGKVYRRTCVFGGDSLKRPPLGYDQQHPLIEDLKRKDFVTMTNFSQEQVCASDFIERYADLCQTTAPLMRLLTKAVGLPW